MTEQDVYALIQNGIVINTILWDGNAENWQPPEGQSLVLVKPEYGAVSIGWKYNGQEFSME